MGPKNHHKKCHPFVCLLASYTMLKNGEKMRICLSISRSQMNFYTKEFLSSIIKLTIYNYWNWNAQLGTTKAEISNYSPPYVLATWNDCHVGYYNTTILSPKRVLIFWRKTSKKWLRKLTLRSVRKKLVSTTSMYFMYFMYIIIFIHALRSCLFI